MLNGTAESSSLTRTPTPRKNCKRRIFIPVVGVVLVCVVVVSFGHSGTPTGNGRNGGLTNNLKVQSQNENVDGDPTEPAWKTCSADLYERFHAIGETVAGGSVRVDKFHSLLDPNAVLSFVKGDSSIETSPMTHSAVERAEEHTDTDLMDTFSQQVCSLYNWLCSSRKRSGFSFFFFCGAFCGFEIRLWILCWLHVAQFKTVHLIRSVGDSVFLLYPDKTVVTADVASCKVTGLYLSQSDGQKVHPSVQEAIGNELNTESDRCTRESRRCGFRRAKCCGKLKCNYKRWRTCVKKKKKSGCFSSSSTTRNVDGSVMKMKDIVAGDDLMRGRDVYFIGHREHEAVSEFIRFETVSLGKSVSATRDHYLPVFVGAGKNKKREMIRFGTLLDMKEKEKEKYYVNVYLNGEFVLDQINGSSVKIAFEKGLYNPYTWNGEVVVNDVVVSCHSKYVLDDHDFFGQDLHRFLPTIYQAMFFPFRCVYFAFPDLALVMDDLFPLGIGEYSFSQVIRALVRVVAQRIFAIGWFCDSQVWSLFTS